MKKSPDKNDLPNYAGNYSDSKLWSKLAKFGKKLGKDTLRYVLLLYYTLKSDQVSLGNKAMIMGALGYLILPVDLIPDFIPILGFADDIAAIKVAYEAIKVSITPEIESQADAKLAEWFGKEEKSES